MKAEELMIGNYVNTINGIKKVSNITVDGYCWFTDNQCEPILLTNEWLMKLGFEKKTYQHLTLYHYSLKVLSHGEISFHPKDNGFNLDIGTTTGYQFGTTNLKYVHQLQNLYFALTLEQLTTKKLNL